MEEIALPGKMFFKKKSRNPSAGSKPSYIKVTKELFIYKLKSLGQYIMSEVEEKIYSDILTISELLPEGGALIFDFANVRIISPSLIFNILSRILKDVKNKRKGFFRGRVLIAKDLNWDNRFLLEGFLMANNLSLLVVYTDGRKKEVLNIPSFLKKALDVIEEKNPISCSELARLLGSEKESITRERLRKLYRRGLVRREAVGTVEGGRYFVYSPLRLSIEKLK